MDGLVAQAEAGRDSAVNQLDSLERETKRANDRLARQVDHFVRMHESAVSKLPAGALEPERPPEDRRFGFEEDPEEEL
jgi:hypothetical protein